MTSSIKEYSKPPFLFFIGNSGSGKDTTMRYVESYLNQEGNDVENIKRVITRETDRNEDSLDVSVSEFKQMAYDIKFAFYWKVYDTYYGYLQDDIDRVIQQDIISLFNISRSLTSVVREKYPWCTLIKINAPTHLTKNRILTRKRGNIEQKEMRIKRMSKEFKLPDDIIMIDNSGSLEDLQNKIKIVCNTLFPKLT